MRLERWSDLERLVETGIPEGQSLEYKRQLNLLTREDRLELLKDLTGMGNGGGGTVVFGVEEGEGAKASRRACAS